MRRKLIKAAKLSVLYSSIGFLLQIFFVNFIFAVTPVKAQSFENVIVSLNLHNVTLEKVFEVLERQINYKFFYIKDEVPVNEITSVEAENEPLSNVLATLAKKHNLIFQRINNQIVIKRAPEPGKKNKKTKIIGTVTDYKTGEPLFGTNVIILGTAFGAATDFNGKFEIKNVSPGKYTLRISYIGYEKKEIPITVESGKVLDLDIKLKYSGAIDLEEVEVTAQAKGQIAAINEQLSSQEIKNVVSKSRIQELPDANAAEAVGRLPGVSILREGGEGNKVVIRGLSPKYNKIMVDGIELASTDASDRSTDISMISPYSLEGIEVIKSATADHDADYIGGSVNFKIKKADKGLKYGIIAQNTYNNLRKSFFNYMLIGSASDRFFNNKLGVFLQFNLEKRDRGANQMAADYYLLTHELDKVNPTKLENLSLNNVFRIKNRYGGTLTLDYDIPDGNVFLKNFLSIGKTKTNKYAESYAVRARNHNYSTTIQENNLMVMSNVLNYEQELAGFKVDASFSHAFSQNEMPEDIGFVFTEPTPALPGGLTDLPPDSIPYFAYNNINDAYWSYVTDNWSLTKERQFSFKANVQTDFSFTEQINGKIKIGGKYRYKTRSHDFEATGGTMALNSGKDVKNAILEAFPWMQETTPIGSPRLPYNLFIDKGFDHGEFLKGRYDLGPVANTDLMRQVINVMRNVKTPAIDTYSKLNMTSTTHDYNGSEYLSAAYVMADINFSSLIKFIPGIRYERNVTEYTGFQGRSDAGFPEQNYPHKDTTTQRTNSFLLPMIHLQIKPFEWLQLRLAYTQTLSRPNFNLIVPRLDIGKEEIIYNNFKLRPEQSENFDIYLSILDNYVGLFTLGVFQKNIKDMIFWLDRRVILDPAEYGFTDLEKDKFIITQQNMDEVAKVKGFEVDWQTNFWYLPSFLKGLVFNINYTHIFSEAKYPRTVIETEYNYTEPPYGVILRNKDTTYTQRLIDQPDDILHLSVGYDYKGFSFRISMLYQANIFKSPNFYRELRSSTDDFLRWDLSVKQKLPIEGLNVYLNAQNITNTTDNVLNSVRKLPTSMEHYGMTVDVGLRWEVR